MDKIALTKTVVHYVTSYSIGIAVTAVLKDHRAHSDNKAVDLAIDAATFVTSVAVSGVLQEKVNAHTDAQIDKIVDWCRSKSRKN